MNLAKIAGFEVHHLAAHAPVAFHDDLFSVLRQAVLSGNSPQEPNDKTTTTTTAPARCLEPAGHFFDDGDLDLLGDWGSGAASQSGSSAPTPLLAPCAPPPGLPPPSEVSAPSCYDIADASELGDPSGVWLSDACSAHGYAAWQQPFQDHGHRQESLRTDFGSAGSATETRTTIMLQRIAFAHTETTVARALNDLGFRGTYDAIYVPRNRRKNTNLGYAFVNFLHPAYAAEAFVQCGDRPLGSLSDRACKVDYSSMQGVAFLQHAWRAPVEPVPMRADMANARRSFGIHTSSEGFAAHGCTGVRSGDMSRVAY